MLIAKIDRFFEKITGQYNLESLLTIFGGVPIISLKSLKNGNFQEHDKRFA